MSIRRLKNFCLYAFVASAAVGKAVADTPFGTVIANSATATYDRGGGVIVSVSSDTVYTIVGEGYLFIQKRTSASTVQIGDTLVYEIEVRNVDDTDVFNVTVTDTLVQTLSFVSSDPEGLLQGNTIRWLIPEIRSGESVTIRITCLVVKAPYTGTIVNEANYTTQHGIRGTSNPAVVELEPWPEARIEKTVQPRQVYVGDTLSYELEVRNTGPMTLTDVAVLDALPAGLEFLWSSAPVDTGKGKFSWEIGKLKSGQEAEMEYKVLVTSAVKQNWLRNVAILYSAEGAADTARAMVKCLGEGANLEVLKQAQDSVYTAGDSIRYEIIVSNTGIRPLAGVTVTDTLSSRLEFVQAEAGGMLNENLVIWNLGTLHPGDTDTLHLWTRIRIPIEDQAEIENIVLASSSSGISDTSSCTVRVNSRPVLSIVKVTEPKAVPGDTLIYSLIFRNTGTAVSYGTILSDTLQPYLEFIGSDSPHLFDPAANAVFWTIDTLSPGKPDTVKLAARISESVSLGTEILNVAWLGEDGHASYAKSSFTTEVALDGDSHLLYLYKTVDKVKAHPGDTLTYRIYYGMNFKSGEDTLHIADTLPKEVRWIEDPAYFKPNVHLRSYDLITNTIRFDVTDVDAAVQDSIILKVYVVEEIDPGVNEIENRATAYCTVDTVHAEDDPRTRARTKLVQGYLEVKKMVNRKIVERGDILTYTVIVENKSEDAYVFPVRVTDTLPPGFRYREGTALWDSSAAPDPAMTQDRDRIRMTWNFQDTLHAKEIRILKYRIVVGLDARFGENTNSVFVTGWSDIGIEIRSEEAEAAVVVRTGILDDKGFIFGKVFIDKNENNVHDDGEPGMKNVELILEDGTRVRTDGYGKFSIPNVEAGQHVLRINTKTLPQGLTPVAATHHFMGDGKSRMIQMSPGSMAKANFILREKTE